MNFLSVRMISHTSPIFMTKFLEKVSFIDDPTGIVLAVVNYTVNVVLALLIIQLKIIFCKYLLL